jgi:hypothetical protein
MAISYVTASEGSIPSGSRSIMVPGTYQAGDTCFIILTASVTPSAGWTTVGGTSALGDPVYVYARDITASSGMSNMSFTLASTAYYGAWLMRTNTSNKEFRVADSYYGVQTGSDSAAPTGVGGGPSGGNPASGFVGMLFCHAWNPDTWSPSIYSTYGYQLLISGSTGSTYLLGSQGRLSDGYSNLNFGGTASDMAWVGFGLKEVDKLAVNVKSMFFGTNF